MSGGGDLTTWDLGDAGTLPGAHVAPGMPFSSAVRRGLSLFAGVTKANPPYVVDTSTGSSVGELPLEPPHSRSMPWPSTGGARPSPSRREAPSSVGPPNTDPKPGRGRWHPRTRGAVTFGADDRVVAILGTGGSQCGISTQRHRSHTRRSPRRRPRSTTSRMCCAPVPPPSVRDGRLLAFTALSDYDRSAIIVWHLRRDQELIRFEGQQVIGFSPDGKQVASKPFNEPAPIVVADVETGKTREVSALPWKEPKPAWADQQRPVSVSMPSDGVLRLVDTERDQCILDLTVTGVPVAPGRRSHPTEGGSPSPPRAARSQSSTRTLRRGVPTCAASPRAG